MMPPMRLRVHLAVSAAVLAGCLPAPPASRAVEARCYRVIRVIDGDTLVIRYDEEATRVRLLAIDAPERGEPGFAAAAAALRELVEGREVRIEFDAAAGRRDPWGRLLARIWVRGPDGVDLDVGADLLARGLVTRNRPR